MKFHSHAYFDHCDPACVAEAHAYRDLIQRAFAGRPVIEVHRLIPFPAGPHPSGSFEVLFTGEAFAEYVAWLMFTRPASIDILIHPLTGSHVLDHTTRALWLGTRRELDPVMLAAADAGNLTGWPTSRSPVDGAWSSCPSWGLSPSTA